MKRLLLIVLISVMIISGNIFSQEIVITDFPVGVGNSINEDFFQPYSEQLNQMSKTLEQDPQTFAIITGGADGKLYQQNHDLKNSAIALSRAHALKIHMIKKFSVESSKLIISTEESKTKGASNRFASIRIVTDISGIKQKLNDEFGKLDTRLTTVENKPPIEKHFTEIKEISAPPDYFGLRLSAGFTSSPFGGIPVLAAAVRWKDKIYFEASLGHTFWNNSFMFEGTDLETKRRLLGGLISYYPIEELPIGVVGGWLRIEEISQKYYEYVKLSEGPMIGVEAIPLEFLTVSVIYNPTKHRLAGLFESISENDQFLLSVKIFKLFGGLK